jgi:hypothetical protein
LTGSHADFFFFCMKQVSMHGKMSALCEMLAGGWHYRPISDSLCCGIVLEIGEAGEASPL